MGVSKFRNKIGDMNVRVAIGFQKYFQNEG